MLARRYFRYGKRLCGGLFSHMAYPLLLQCPGKKKRDYREDTWVQQIGKGRVDVCLRRKKSEL